MTRKSGQFSAGRGQRISREAYLRPGSEAGIRCANQESTALPSAVGLEAAVVRRRGRNAQFRLQHGDARLQRLVFLAGEPGHVLDRLEFLALDDIEVAEDFLGLVADHSIDLALDTLRGTG